MALDQVEDGLKHYLSELEAMQDTLQNVHQGLRDTVAEAEALLGGAALTPLQKSLDELHELHGTLDQQLLVDMRDASAYRLTTLRRFLHET
ncbi:hypothetical protein CWI80_03895 [Pseudidiomarina sediminum]|uniref:Uncharacterized protein n=1 Tax=Pseudidiomarina sediminum TaxID=431675 RepID=A0A432ZAT9_9GAMM|nr:hypothetical protein [Pseudidiomarina sediminum]RUO74492.1 hypothetical protein CWI80_03895 [Pseudidiomarina sediminum]